MNGINGQTRLLGVFGNPVTHSLSPVMHNYVLQKLEVNAVYVPLEIREKTVGQAMEALRTFNFIGVNVTIPFKQAVIPFLDSIDPLADKQEAVNTILQKEGRLHGTSTDGLGFTRAFEAAGHSFTDKTVALVGTGGAARSVAFHLISGKKIKELVLVGRTPDKLKAFRRTLKKKPGGDPVPAGALGENAAGISLYTCPLSVYGDVSERVDVVVNTTPLGMAPHLEESVLEARHLHPHQIVYDLIYNPRTTKLMERASSRGCRCLGGLGMLVYQGLASMELWLDRKLDSEMYFEALNQSGHLPA